MPEVLRGKAFAEELGATDVTHDGFGGAIYSYLDAMEQAPGLLNDMRAAAGLLRKFRAALRDEIAENEALPRDLEQQVFAFIDELEERRGPAKAKEKGGG